MGVPTSEVDYTIATTRRATTKVHKNMWWHWGGGGGKSGTAKKRKDNKIEGWTWVLLTPRLNSAWSRTLTDAEKECNIAMELKEMIWDEI